MVRERAAVAASVENCSQVTSVLPAIHERTTNVSVIYCVHFASHCRCGGVRLVTIYQLDLMLNLSVWNGAAVFGRDDSSQLCRTSTCMDGADKFLQHNSAVFYLNNTCVLKRHFCLFIRTREVKGVNKNALRFVIICR